MNRWLINFDCNLEYKELIDKLIEKIKENNCENNDILLTYTKNCPQSGIFLQSLFEIKLNEKIYSLLEKYKINKEIDLPYSIFYKTEKLFNMINISEKEYNSIIDKSNENNIKELFSEYIMSLDLKTKKIPTRIKYLDEILPSKISSENPISIFTINKIDELNNIKNELQSGGKYFEWDRNGSYSGEILQTLNMYINFLNNEKSEKDTNIKAVTNENSFKSFLNKINPNQDLKVHSSINNIKFMIGQPNTGKSFDFEEKQIFNNGINNSDYKYLKIPVSGGIGNEYKGLQNTDLAITYDPIKIEVRFGEFLQILMSAIVNPNVPHVIFLDDFHNQDISSLLSEYTPLFKSQQKRDIPNINSSHEIFKQTFNSTDEFIKIWNKFIKKHCLDIPRVPITNRISGESLYLVYPSNFYLLGAANFNANSLNIFADWEDRAKIQYKQPINDFLESPKYKEVEKDEFFNCCLTLNNKLKEILKKRNIFDSEKYCFGMWKIFDAEQKLIRDKEQQKELVKFFLGMIKNSLRFNNKNSLINKIGEELLKIMQNDTWFKTNFNLSNEKLNSKDLNEILHEFNIYEDDI